jgi:hypothetical protein
LRFQSFNLALDRGSAASVLGGPPGRTQGAWSPSSQVRQFAATARAPGDAHLGGRTTRCRLACRPTRARATHGLRLVEVLALARSCNYSVRR